LFKKTSVIGAVNIKQNCNEVADSEYSVKIKERKFREMSPYLAAS
jgi:hypothetical protein